MCMYDILAHIMSVLIVRNIKPIHDIFRSRILYIIHHIRMALVLMTIYVSTLYVILFVNLIFTSSKPRLYKYLVFND